MIEYENLNQLNKPFIQDYQKKFDEVVRSGWYVLGNQVKEFEARFSEYCGSPFCVGVGNGLDALILALRSFHFKPQDEVIVPANTYVATILAIIHAQLSPVLVEPDEETCNLDPKKIEEAITPRTVAILPVHLYGRCCAMDEIRSIADRFTLKIIEDCAQAHGARFKGRKAGTFGDIGAFSFYPTKNLGALGDGGAITTANENIKQEIDLLRNYGSGKKYFTERIGVNSRLDELQAAFLLVKLKSLDAIIEHKKKLAALYLENLKEVFVKPRVHPDYYDVYHIFNVRHPKRDQLREYLFKHHVQTEIHYPTPPHKQPALRHLFEDNAYPITEEIHSTTLSLPISSIHGETDILQVIEVMNRF